MITCCECLKKIHYSCSMLPAYQIYVFKTTNRKFTCKNCVNPEFKDTIILQDDKIAITDEYEGRLALMNSEVEFLRNELTLRVNDHKQQKSQLNSVIDDNKIEICRIKTIANQEKKKNAEKTREINNLKKSLTNKENVDFKIANDTQLSSQPNEKLKIKDLQAQVKKSKCDFDLACQDIERLQKDLSVQTNLAAEAKCNSMVYKQLVETKEELIRSLSSKHKANVALNNQSKQSSDDRICFNFQKGLCNNSLCKFVHPKIKCKFYGSPNKCKYGLKCKFSHNFPLYESRPSSHYNNVKPSVHQSPYQQYPSNHFLNSTNFENSNPNPSNIEAMLNSFLNKLDLKINQPNLHQYQNSNIDYQTNGQMHEPTPTHFLPQIFPYPRNK